MDFNGAAFPEHLRVELEGYFLHRREPSHFLRAVLCNDLSLAYARADTDNRQYIPDLVDFLWVTGHVPLVAFGSTMAYEAWING